MIEKRNSWWDVPIQSAIWWDCKWLGHQKSSFLYFRAFFCLEFWHSISFKHDIFLENEPLFILCCLVSYCNNVVSLHSLIFMNGIALATGAIFELYRADWGILLCVGNVRCFTSKFCHLERGAWGFIFGPLAENCFIWLLWPGLLHGINVIKTKSSWMGVYRMIFAIQNVIFKPLVTWARSFCLSELFMFPLLRAKLFSFAATIDLIKQYYQHFLG